MIRTLKDVLKLRSSMRAEGYRAFAIEPPAFSHRPIMRVAQTLTTPSGEHRFMRLLRRSGVLGSSISPSNLWCEIEIADQYKGVHELGSGRDIDFMVATLHRQRLKL